MGLDSLLASLKSEVSEVSRVQGCKGAAFERYPVKPEGVSEVSSGNVGALRETPATPPAKPEVSTRAASVGACTPDTPATPQELNTQTGAQQVGAGETATGSELTRLVALVAAREGFTPEEHAEAVTHALNDPGAALPCFRAILQEALDKGPDY
jgi:hypothetical protein